MSQDTQNTPKPSFFERIRNMLPSSETIVNCVGYGASAALRDLSQVSPLVGALAVLPGAIATKCSTGAGAVPAKAVEAISESFKHANTARNIGLGVGIGIIGVLGLVYIGLRASECCDPIKGCCPKNQDAAGERQLLLPDVANEHDASDYSLFLG